jgi:hypothetical protein
MERYWKVHAIRALKIHQPDAVQKDEGNILTNFELTKSKEDNDGEVPSWDKENSNFPLWTVKGLKFEHTYCQMDNYSCGSIAINRFAMELKKLYDAKPSATRTVDDKVDASILEKVLSPDDLKEKNCKNAAELFKHLLRTKQDAFSPTTTTIHEEETIGSLVSVPKEKSTMNGVSMETPTTIQCDTEGAMKAGEKETNTKGESKATKKRKRCQIDVPVQPSVDASERSRRNKTILQTESSLKKKDERQRLKSTRKQKSNNCQAGQRCRMPRVEFVLDGEKVNASKCTGCGRTCHLACLFQWRQQKLYCIHCYKKAAIQTEDKTTLFDDIFEKNKKARGKATPVVQDLQDFIDNYLRTSRFEMSSKQFYEWRKLSQKNCTNQRLEKGFPLEGGC